MISINSAWAESFFSVNNWSVHGQNEFSFDNYDVDGDKNQSAFKNEGDFFSNRLNFYLDRDEENGRLTNIQFSGLLADDKYLLNNRSYSIQYLGVSTEHGDGEIPYRLGVGDFTADFSRRTLTRSLKGVSIEVQPMSWNSSSLSQSLLFVSGSGGTDWHNIGNNNIWFHGGSYLIGTSFYGYESFWNIGAVFADNSEKSLSSKGTLGLRQTQSLLSMGGEVKFSKAIKVESEISSLKIANTKSTGGKSVSHASSYHLLATGSYKPIRYRSLLELTERKYTPAGAIGVVPNRRAYDNFIEYRLPRDWRARTNLRLSIFHTNLAGNIEQVNNQSAAWGYSFQPLSKRKALIVKSRLTQSQFKSKSNRVNRTLKGISFFATDKYSNGYFGSLRGSYHFNRNKAASNSDADLTSQSISIGRNFRADISDYNVGMRVALGVNYNRRMKSVGSNHTSPLVSTRARWRDHTFSLYYDSRRIDFESGNQIDYSNKGTRVSYSYDVQPHEIQFNFSTLTRDPKTGIYTKSTRMSFDYIYNFAN